MEAPNPTDFRLVHINLDEVPSVSAAILDALTGGIEPPFGLEEAAQIPGTVVHLTGQGVYDFTDPIRFQAEGIHLIFEPGITLRLTQPGIEMFTLKPTTSITGVTIDANNLLDGQDRGSPQVATGGSWFDCNFRNSGGELHATPNAPIALSTAVVVVRCTFDRFHCCVRLADLVTGCEFGNLLDDVGPGADPDRRPLGGGFAFAVRHVIGNRTAAGTPTFLPGEVGGSVIQFNVQQLALPPDVDVDPDAALTNDVRVEDNYIYSPPGAFKDNTGVSGDVIALKSVADFSVQRNVIDGGGEFGIVVTHGSAHGVIADNIVRGTDGAGLVIGAENDIVLKGGPDRPLQQSPRVANIDVSDNLLVDIGLDVNNERRGGARPERTTIGNYPNAITGIRVWNASNIRVSGNVVNRYRSSGMWIKDAFTRDIDDRLAEYGTSERALNEVLGLTITADNVFVPFRGDGTVAFNDSTWDFAPASGAALEPWSGTSFVPDEQGAKTDTVVGGFEASQIVSRSRLVERQVRCVEPTQVTITSRCAAGLGRIDVRIINTALDDAIYVVEVTGLAPREIELAAGNTGLVSVTGRPSGDYLITVRRNDEQIDTQMIMIECG